MGAKLPIDEKLTLPLQSGSEPAERVSLIPALATRCSLQSLTATRPDLRSEAAQTCALHGSSQLLLAENTKAKNCLVQSRRRCLSLTANSNPNHAIKIYLRQFRVLQSADDKRYFRETKFAFSTEC
jgi:hypothetical protein